MKRTEHSALYWREVAVFMGKHTATSDDSSAQRAYMHTEFDDEDIQEFLDQIPEQYIVTQEELDPQVYSAFLDYVPDIPTLPHAENLLQDSECLFDAQTSHQRKQDLLCCLAGHGTVAAYRLIERYTQQADPALAMWSQIALYECRMALERELLDRPVGLISTGLGGEAHRLRCVVMLGLTSPPLPSSSHDTIREIWQQACGRHDSILERVQFAPSYLLIQVLISMHVAVAAVIEESIARINRNHVLVYQDYFVTNIRIPTDEDIQSALREIRRGG
jgi:hypothetical protein